MSHLRLYDPGSAECDSEPDFPATLPLRGSLDSGPVSGSPVSVALAAETGLAPLGLAPLGLAPVGHEPAGLADRASVERTSIDRATMLTRARMLRANSTCPHCRRSSVLPLMLNDAAVGRDNLPIPGTATLVGFRCDHCRNEWPASDHRNQ